MNKEDKIIFYNFYKFLNECYSRIKKMDDDEDCDNCANCPGQCHEKDDESDWIIMDLNDVDCDEGCYECECEKKCCESKCDCGGDKLGLPHSDWCSKNKKK